MGARDIGLSDDDTIAIGRDLPSESIGYGETGQRAYPNTTPFV